MDGWMDGGVEGDRKARRKGGIRTKVRDIHSAQLGDDAIVDVICLFRALRLGFDEGSSRISSWRFEGGSVKRRGRDILACACWLNWVFVVSVGRYTDAIRGSQYVMLKRVQDEEMRRDDEEERNHAHTSSTPSPSTTQPGRLHVESCFEALRSSGFQGALRPLCNGRRHRGRGPLGAC